MKFFNVCEDILGDVRGGKSSDICGNTSRGDGWVKRWVFVGVTTLVPET